MNKVEKEVEKEVEKLIECGVKYSREKQTNTIPFIFYKDSSLYSIFHDKFSYEKYKEIIEKAKQGLQQKEIILDLRELTF